MNIKLLETAKEYVPACIWDKHENLHLIEIRNNRAFISTGPDITGQLCTFVRLGDIETKAG